MKTFETANLIKESNRDLKVLVTDIENKLSSIQELKNNLYSYLFPNKLMILS